MQIMIVSAVVAYVLEYVNAVSADHYTSALKGRSK
jgi:hypothetical protein